MSEGFAHSLPRHELESRGHEKHLWDPTGRGDSDTFVCQENDGFPVWPDINEESFFLTKCKD